jgi:hypothetical protein
MADPVRTDNRASFAKLNFPLSLAWGPSELMLMAARFLRIDGGVIQSFASFPN